MRAAKCLQVSEQRQAVELWERVGGQREFHGELAGEVYLLACG